MNNFKIDIQLDTTFYFKYKQINNFYLVTNSQQNENYIKNVQPNNLNDFLKITTTIKDSFAFIYNDENYLFVAVDKLRSFPILYTIENNNIFVGNNISNEIKSKAVIDKEQVEIFKTIYTTNNENTLLKNVKQLNSGQYLFVDKINEKIKIDYYFKHTNNSLLLSEAKLLESYHNQIKVLQQNYKHHTFVVPLSAGYDSRTIVALLKLNNIDNVLTYTYGVRNSFEHKTAQKVAQQLNYKHLFIEYNEDCLNEFLSTKFIDFTTNNHHYTGLPNEQDYFALAYMQQHNLIPTNALFLPGTFADCFAASMYQSEFYLSYYKKHINNNLLDYRQWYSINRAAKFSTNGIRTFECFNYPWFILFNHNDLFQNWYSIPTENAYKIYEQFLMQHFFKPLQIDFYKPHHPTKTKFKQLFKNILPNILVKYIQNKNLNTINNDPINAQYLSKQFKKLIKDKKFQKQNNFNTLWAYYFIQKFIYNEENTDL